MFWINFKLLEYYICSERERRTALPVKNKQTYQQQMLSPFYNNFLQNKKKTKKIDSDFVLGEVDMTMWNKTE